MTNLKLQSSFVLNLNLITHRNDTNRNSNRVVIIFDIGNCTKFLNEFSWMNLFGKNNRILLEMKCINGAKDKFVKP